MSRDREIKRKLLAQAVVSNLESADERRQRLLRKTARRSSRRLGAAFVFALPFAGISVAQLLLPSTPADTSGALAGRPPSTANAVAIEMPLQQPTFSAPRPIDPKVLPLAIRRIVLDPGHGGDDHGAGIGGPLIEKDVALDIAQRLQRRLLEAKYEVLLTRDQDHSVSLKERVDLANQQHADIFVSIHLNWIETRDVRGVETYFLGPTSDPALSHLAQQENRASGYTLTDMRRLLEGIYADVRQNQSRGLAESVQQALFRSIDEFQPGVRNRGVKTAPFIVLVATEMPAILAEVSCLSNAHEVELLGRPRYREHIAEALFKGIESYAHKVNQAG